MRIGFALLILALSVCAQQAKQEFKVPTPSDPISGNWDGHAQFAGIPAVRIKLNLVLKGNVVSGVVTSPEPLPITQGSWSGDKLVLRFSQATMSASLRGGHLIGEMLNLSGVKGTWEARKATGTPGSSRVSSVPETLPELLGTIRDSLDRDATATEGDDPTRTRKVVHPAFASCALAYTDTTFIESKAIPAMSGSIGVDVAFSLGELDADATSVKPNAEYHAHELILRTI